MLPLGHRRHLLADYLVAPGGLKVADLGFRDPPPGWRLMCVHTRLSLEKCLIHGTFSISHRSSRADGLYHGASWRADLCLIQPDETAGPEVERTLTAQAYDCVVIGAGIRLPPRSLSMFEAVINAVHRAAPGAVIAFNTRPEDSADAAGRWLQAN